MKTKMDYLGDLRPKVPTRVFAELTDRGRAIRKLIVQGYKNPEIAS